jgi:predicted methyltransferase
MRARVLGRGLLPLVAFSTAMMVSTVALGQTADSAAIKAAVADTHRAPAQTKRDQYRHPAETLAFFGLRTDQTVVEFQPSGGWYTAILAPLLASKGHYIGLVAHTQKAQDGLAKLIADGGERYHGATAATLDPSAGSSTVPDGSADVVLTFRNVHNLIMDGTATANGAFKAFFRMLKPGGVLGVEDHHLPESADSAAEQKSGYLKRSTVVHLAEAAGFRLAGESDVNANPKDTHDWPEGVWTLPPTLELGDKDRDKYLAIGESDRLTLKFVKP